MRYFAYGSNLDPAELIGACPGARRLYPATLEDYRRDFTRYSPRRGGGVADIVPDATARVLGGVYEIPEDDLAHLDAKEGVAAGAYERIEVELQTAHETVTAMTYRVVQPIDPVAPTAAYLDLILRGIEAWALPSSEARSVVTGARALGLGTAGQPHADTLGADDADGPDRDGSRVASRGPS